MKARLIEVGWLTILRSNREIITAEINTLSELIAKNLYTLH
jgi:hypothetical protein